MILNFNGLKWLKICLPSVMKSNYENLDVYLIDNGSTDGSSEFVKSDYPKVNMVSFAQNLGFPEAYNRAIRSVKADYVLLLNNDTEVLNPRWIDILVDRADNGPSIAAVGCKLVTMEDHQRLDSVGVMGIKYWRGFVDIGKYETDRGKYDRPPIIPFSVCSAAMLIRKKAFDQVGGFDSKFCAYVEDVDLCWRLRLVGYEIIYEPSARVAHYFSGTHGSKEVDARKLYLSHRNVLRAIMKNCGDSVRWAAGRFLLYSIVLMGGLFFVSPARFLAVGKALAWNILNLSDTYRERLRVQSARQLSDARIVPLIFPPFKRLELSGFSRFRRVLDQLFT
jgi:hypothetical protein